MSRSVGDDKNILTKVWPCTVNSTNINKINNYLLSHVTEHKNKTKTTQHIFNVKTIKTISGITLSSILKDKRLEKRPKLLVCTNVNVYRNDEGILLIVKFKRSRINIIVKS